MIGPVPPETFEERRSAYIKSSKGVIQREQPLCVPGEDGEGERIKRRGQRSSVPVRVLGPGGFLAFSGALGDVVSLELGEGEEDSDHEHADGGIVHQAHVQDVDRDARVNKLLNLRSAIHGRPGEAIELGHN